MLWDVRIREQINEYGVAVKSPVMELLGAHAMKKVNGRRTPSSAGAGDSASKSVTGLLFAMEDSMLVSR
jgi:hypothetical protein